MIMTKSITFKLSMRWSLKLKEVGVAIAVNSHCLVLQTVKPDQLGTNVLYLHEAGLAGNIG